MKHNFYEWANYCFFSNFNDYFSNSPAPEGSIKILSQPIDDKFTDEERETLNHIKQIAVDVEYEEIQG